MKMIKAIVFDLDNTLYDQKLFNCGAFDDVSVYISKKFGMDKKSIHELLVRSWKAAPGSPDIFDKILRKIGIDGIDIKKLVDVFHRHKPKLKLFPNTKGVLLKLKKKYKLGMLTDGRVSTQKKKIAALGIGGVFDEIVFTSERGIEISKPNKAPYEHAIRRLKMSPNEVVYVGDNPRVDFVSAKKIGMVTIRILKGCFKDVRAGKEIDADYTIKNLDEIFGILESLTGRGW